MKRLYIETYGCQMNVADSEVVASVMKMAGYEVCDNEADADASILVPSVRMRKTASTIVWNSFTPSRRRAASSSSACWAAWQSE